MSLPLSRKPRHTRIFYVENVLVTSFAVVLRLFHDATALEETLALRVQINVVFLPSSSSREAPPPVETWDTLSSVPHLAQHVAVSPPPVGETWNLADVHYTFANNHPPSEFFARLRFASRFQILHGIPDFEPPLASWSYSVFLPAPVVSGRIYGW